MPSSTSPWDKLLEHGVLGIVLLIALYVISYLWRRLLADRDAKDAMAKAHAAELVALQKEHAATIAALQESRLQAMEKVTGALINATAAMSKQAETNEEMNDSLRSIANDYQNRHRGGPPR
jgi:Tfp pilus assembly protein PilO